MMRTSTRVDTAVSTGRNVATRERIVRFYLWAALLGMVVAVWSGDLCAYSDSEQATHSIGVLLGKDYLGSRDDAGSPLIYYGEARPLALRYGYTKKNRQHSVSAWATHTGFNADRLETTIAEVDRHYARATLGSLDYSLLWRVTKPRRLQLWLGPQWSNFFFYRNYQYEPNQIGSVDVWEAMSSLDIASQISLFAGKRHHFYTRLVVPVVAYTNRAAYGVRGDERLRFVLERDHAVTRGRIASWNTLQMVDISAGYSIRVLGPMHIDLVYDMSFYRYSEPLPTRMLRHRVAIGSSFNF